MNHDGHIARIDTNGAGQVGWAANDNHKQTLRQRVFEVLVAMVKLF